MIFGSVETLHHVETLHRTMYFKISKRCRNVPTGNVSLAQTENVYLSHRRITWIPASLYAREFKKSSYAEFGISEIPRFVARGNSGLREFEKSVHETLPQPFDCAQGPTIGIRG